MGSKKTQLIITALALFASLVGLVVLGLRPDEWVDTRISDTHQGPWFVVQVVRPRSGRPLFGLLPKVIETKMQGNDEQGFDNESRGANIGSIGHDRVEFSADGWELVIVIDDEGQVTSGTHLVFPMTIANKQRTLRCLPADLASGYLRTTKSAGADTLNGRFVVEFAHCENLETGNTIEWPPAALTVRGGFSGLPSRRR